MVASDDAGNVRHQETRHEHPGTRRRRGRARARRAGSFKRARRRSARRKLRSRDRRDESPPSRFPALRRARPAAVGNCGAATRVFARDGVALPSSAGGPAGSNAITVVPLRPRRRPVGHDEICKAFAGQCHVRQDGEARIGKPDPARAAWRATRSRSYDCSVATAQHLND